MNTLKNRKLENNKKDKKMTKPVSNKKREMMMNNKNNKKMTHKEAVDAVFGKKFCEMTRTEVLESFARLAKEAKKVAKVTKATKVDMSVVGNCGEADIIGVSSNCKRGVMIQVAPDAKGISMSVENFVKELSKCKGSTKSARHSDYISIAGFVSVSAVAAVASAAHMQYFVFAGLNNENYSQVIGQATWDAAAKADKRRGANAYTPAPIILF